MTFRHEVDEGMAFVVMFLDILPELAKDPALNGCDAVRSCLEYKDDDFDLLSRSQQDEIMMLAEVVVGYFERRTNTDFSQAFMNAARKVYVQRLDAVLTTDVGTRTEIIKHVGHRAFNLAEHRPTTLVRSTPTSTTAPLTSGTHPTVHISLRREEPTADLPCVEFDCQPDATSPHGIRMDQVPGFDFEDSQRHTDEYAQVPTSEKE